MTEETKRKWTHYRWCERTKETEEWKPLNRYVNDKIEEQWMEEKKGDRNANQVFSWLNGQAIDFIKMKTFNRENEATRFIFRGEEWIDYQWYWLDTKKDNWLPIPFHENLRLEEEWQTHKNGRRGGQRQYHWGPSGDMMNVDFRNMKTYSDTSDPIPNPDPKSYKIKRMELQ